MTDIRTKRTSIRARLPTLLLLASSCLPGAQAAMPGDTHHNDAGFFDIHVCNWPGRPPFFMPLFSMARFNKV